MNNNVDKISDAVSHVLSVFADAETKMMALQPVLIDLLTACRDVNDMRTVKESPDIKRLFERQYAGVDRQRLITWVETYSPIRIKMKDGRFDKLGFCKAKNGEPDQWDIAGATACNWWDSEKTETRSFKTGEFLAARKALAKTIVRKVYANTGGYDTAAFTAMVEELMATFREDLLSSCRDYRDSDKFDDWREGFDALQKPAEDVKSDEDARRAAGQARIKAQHAETLYRQWKAGTIPLADFPEDVQEYLPKALWLVVDEARAEEEEADRKAVNASRDKAWNASVVYRQWKAGTITLSEFPEEIQRDLPSVYWLEVNEARAKAGNTLTVQ